MAALDPAPFFMGGYAEDALLAGGVTRPHEDLDWVLPRAELPVRLAQANELGFSGFETWGESAPGEPFYLFAQNGDLRLDLGVSDGTKTRPLMKVHRLVFEVDGREAPAGYPVRLPSDMYSYPPVEIEGITIRTISPLALYQIRLGIAQQGSFGPLSERQLSSMRQLRERFFSHHPERELDPGVEPMVG